MLTAMKERAEQIILVTNLKDIPLENIAKIICKAMLKEQGWYGCIIANKRTLFIYQK